MDIGSIFLILALLLLAALFVTRPLFERTAVSVSQEEHLISSLLAERDRLIRALQELDFDYKLGKIPEEDYPAQRALLLQKGADILRELDSHQEVQGLETAESRMEAALTERAARGKQARTAVGSGGNGGAHPDDALEAQIAQRRRARQEKSAGFCPQCGGPVQKSDVFCPKCGARLKA